MTTQSEQIIESQAQTIRALRDQVARLTKDLARARAGNALALEEIAFFKEAHGRLEARSESDVLTSEQRHVLADALAVFVGATTHWDLSTREREVVEGIRAKLDQDNDD
jgi:hypothetical protein